MHKDTKSAVEWLDNWAEKAKKTGVADKARFEAAVKECYSYAGLPWHGKVVWVNSPLVLAMVAMPLARLLGEEFERGHAVSDKIMESVVDPLREGISAAMPKALEDTYEEVFADSHVAYSLRRNIGDNVRKAVNSALKETLSESMTAGQMLASLPRLVQQDVLEVLENGLIERKRGLVEALAEIEVLLQQPATEVFGTCRNLLGGQLSIGSLREGAGTSYLREICGLQLPDGLWEKAKAFEATMESAAWWYPANGFVVACNRPQFFLGEDSDLSIVWVDGWLTERGKSITFQPKMAWDTSKARAGQSAGTMY